MPRARRTTPPRVSGNAVSVGEGFTSTSMAAIDSAIAEMVSSEYFVSSPSRIRVTRTEMVTLLSMGRGWTEEDFYRENDTIYVDRELYISRNLYQQPLLSEASVALTGSPEWISAPALSSVRQSDYLDPFHSVISEILSSNDNDEDGIGEMYGEDEGTEAEEFREITASDFPEYNIPSWDNSEHRETVVNLYLKQMGYRLRWIFYREEKEGFRRRSHGVKPFGKEDFLDRCYDRGCSHPLDTEDSKFYDWNIGASDFILRFECFRIRDRDALRIHFIHRDTMKEICYQDRLWDGVQYNKIAQFWA